jgi:hypothetical protein
MAKIDQHPWVKEHASDYKRALKDVRNVGQDHDSIEYVAYHKGRLHAARDMAKQYGSGYDMEHHGEGKKHGEK